MKRGKVQTVDSGANVLVEHEEGINKHYSHLDVDVLCEKLSDEEIKKEFSKLEITLEQMKDILKYKKGFAISHCHNREGKFTDGDLFKFKTK